MGSKDIENYPPLDDLSKPPLPYPLLLPTYFMPTIYNTQRIKQILNSNAG